jgi:iron(III) transport system ATP-binding protein
LVRVLRLEGLTKRFAGENGAGTLAVDDVSLTIEPGLLYTLLGPSGCGKTTTLRCVAGLERPDAGEIEVGGRSLFSSRSGSSVPPNERGLGMVFQSYGLWPHMSVFDTVAFPLVVGPRRGRPRAGEVRERVERALAIVQLEGLESRNATELSGGQQQRLALARALVIEPPLLLMDEPLSNLDARLRDDMRLELKRMQRELGVTSLYVTHDQSEALALSNTVAVMRDGRIEQVGKPREIYEQPRSRFVAEFLGSANLVEGVVRGGGAVETAHGTLVLRSAAGFSEGERVVAAIRAELIGLEPHVDGAGGDLRPNHLHGSVRNRAFRGESVDHVVLVGERELRVRSPAALSIPQGTKVTLSVPEEGCPLIPAEDRH